MLGDAQIGQRNPVGVLPQSLAIQGVINGRRSMDSIADGLGPRWMLSGRFNGGFTRG